MAKRNDAAITTNATTTQDEATLDRAYLQAWQRGARAPRDWLRGRVWRETKDKLQAANIPRKDRGAVATTWVLDMSEFAPYVIDQGARANARPNAAFPGGYWNGFEWGLKKLHARLRAMARDSAWNSPMGLLDELEIDETTAVGVIPPSRPPGVLPVE